MEQAHRQQRGTRSAKDKSTGMDHPEWQRGQAEKKKRERGSLSEEERTGFRRELKELTARAAKKLAAHPEADPFDQFLDLAEGGRAHEEQ